MVRAHGGVATGETLAPLLEPDRDCEPEPAAAEEATAVAVDEAYVLPALVALRGDAQVARSADPVCMRGCLRVRVDAGVALLARNILYRAQAAARGRGDAPPQIREKGGAGGA